MMTSKMKINAASHTEDIKEIVIAKVIEHEGKLCKIENVLDRIDKNVVDMKEEMHRMEVDMVKMEGRIVSGYKKYFWMYVIFFATSLGITHHFEMYFKKLLGL